MRQRLEQLKPSLPCMADQGVAATSTEQASTPWVVLVTRAEEGRDQCSTKQKKAWALMKNRSGHGGSWRTGRSNQIFTAGNIRGGSSGALNQIAADPTERGLSPQRAGPLKPAPPDPLKRGGLLPLAGLSMQAKNPVSMGVPLGDGSRGGGTPDPEDPITARLARAGALFSRAGRSSRSPRVFVHFSFWLHSI